MLFLCDTIWQIKLLVTRSKKPLQTYATTQSMAIDGKYGHFIHELLINNQQTCSIVRSPWAGNSRS